MGSAAGASDQPGNYLVTLDGEPLYVGEAKNLAARLRQQFRPSGSTFFKNFQRAHPDTPREIGEFRVRHMETSLGRKEVEDFGIVNIPAPLNRFQLNKRERIPPATGDARWREIQARSREILAEGELTFLATPRSPMFEAEVPTGPGLYAVWSAERDSPIYLGESSDIGKRHKTHCQQTYFSALRRHVGTDVHGFELKVIKGRRRYFSDQEDQTVTRFLRSCQFSCLPVRLGRVELEEWLIARHHPLLNRKGNAARKG
ncbi:MAG: hypothetical protein GY898_16270 [Proteobacteria bacterium]|nr:hypothetical protein [Pseudomonadota bacterium]